jgi:hypothetical protein
MKPFERLMVEDAEFDEELLADALAAYVGIGRETGHLIWTSAARGLSTKPRLIAYLLARIALCRLGFCEEEWASPKQVEEGTGVPGGTVRRTLRELQSARLAQSQGGRYRVAPFGLAKAVDVLKGGVCDE